MTRGIFRKTGLFTGALIPLIAMGIATSAVAKEPGIPRGEKVFNWIDRDKDGKIQLNEIEPRSIKRFMKLDADKNDNVTVAEIESWLRARMERRRDRIMRKMDADKNGSISRAELSRHIKHTFALADKDRNGGVTITEARAYHIEKRKRFWAQYRANRKALKKKQ